MVFLLKEAYERLYPESKGDNCYLKVSRQSLRVPYLFTKPAYKAYVELLPGFKKISVSGFLEMLGLSQQERGEVLDALHLDGSACIRKEQLPKSDLLRHVYTYCTKKYAASIQTHYALVRLYLEQNGFHGRVAVVDVGWRESIQRMLQRVASDKASLEGFYIALTTPFDEPMLSFSGQGGRILLDIPGLFFEKLMMPADGSESTTAYAMDASCHATPIERQGLASDQSQTKNLSLLHALQLSALKFLEDFQTIESGSPAFIDSAVSMGGMKRLFAQPTKEALVLAI